MGKKKHGKKKTGAKRRTLRILNIFLAIILILMLSITFMVISLMNKMNRTDGTVETMSQEEMDAYLAAEMTAGQEDEQNETTPTVHEDEVDWGTEATIEDSEHTVHILLIGQDRLAGEERARSDSMILVSVNKEKNTITMTSFLRDLYVKIPGYKNNRLNSAYTFGGMELLNATLEQNFGVVVDGNIEVDFDQFEDIVNLLGGVDMELRADEANLINTECGGNLVKGMNHMNGFETLVYARIRKLDANRDFSRTERQRKVLTTLIEKLKESDLATLLDLVNEALPMVTTDMSNAEILGYATSLLPMLSTATVNSQRIPADNTYYDASVNGMAVLVADMNAARRLLQNTIGE